MRLAQVTLQAPADRLAALADFYTGVLDVVPVPTDHDLSLAVGADRLCFDAGPTGTAPFYHFALLVPGDRFSAAAAWVRERVTLLNIGDSSDSTIHFGNWNADSCYFHDPAENIVELIAHAGIGERGTLGPFGPRELMGISEIGMVGEVAALRAGLEARGLAVCQAFGPLTFIGQPTAALILAAPGYGWLPRGRPAEPWPVDAAVGNALATSASRSDGPRANKNDSPARTDATDVPTMARTAPPLGDGHRITVLPPQAPAGRSMP